MPKTSRVTAEGARRGAGPKAEEGPRRRLYEDVRERLLRLIEEERLRPGDLLPSERELMDSYGIGRPAVREAIQSLARAGILTITHGGRTRIAEPSMGTAFDQINLAARHVLRNSPASLDHLKEARMFFEMEMARRASIRPTKAGIRNLRRILAKQAALIDGPEEFLRLDGEFHAAIAQMSGNPIFVEVSEAMFAWLSRFHQSLVRAPGREQLTIVEHSRILDAIERADAEAAAGAMQEHLTRANDLYRQLHP